MWENYYNKNYRVRFAIEGGLGNIASSSITGIVLVGTAGILSVTGHAMTVNFGVPFGVYATVGFSAIIATLANIKKKSEYWKKQRDHHSIQNDYDEESYLYKLVSKYITMGDKYLLQLYRQSLEGSTSKEKDEFEYLDFDNTNLSPLMLKALEEIKIRLVELRDELRTDILKNIHFMQLQIAESTTISISELEEVQKMLKQYVPKIQK